MEASILMLPTHLDADSAQDHAQRVTYSKCSYEYLIKFDNMMESETTKLVSLSHWVH